MNSPPPCARHPRRVEHQVFDDLEDEGHFYDPLAEEVKEVFLPWLMDDVVQRVDKAVDSIVVVDGKRERPKTKGMYVMRQSTWIYGT